MPLKTWLAQTWNLAPLSVLSYITAVCSWHIDLGAATVDRNKMVRLAGELERVSTFMSGTGFYFCHVINKRDAIVKLNMADTVTIDNISLPVRKYVKICVV
jgi:hypothetical protein